MTKQTVVASQNISRMCMVCGTENSAGLKAQFLQMENGELLGVFQPQDVHQGYPGRLHGGVASTMLDETIGRAVNIAEPDSWGVTVELTVRFKQPVPLGGDVRAVARITRNSRRLFEGTGEIVLPDGSIAVEASGKFLKMPIDRIAEGDFSSQWFADKRKMPESVEL